MRKVEHFCCIRGSCVLATINVQTEEVKEHFLDEEKREFVKVNPYESHSLRNHSDFPCEILIIINEEYNPDDPDTFNFKGE